MQSSPNAGPSPSPRFWARIAPALLLVVLAPLVAEFLLGDFAVRQLYLLVILLPLYGGGALLIREVTRRTHRGWPTIVVLAVAYGVFEEGVTTMSLFNPHYAGMHLLRYGFVPALGTSFVWDVFVIGIHVVFSIATPILIAEGVAGPRRTEPWLRLPGLMVAAALLVLGGVVDTSFQVAASHFVASAGQLLAVTLLVNALTVAAFTAFPPRTPRPDGSGSWLPWLAFPAVLGLLSVFEVVRHVLPGQGVAAAWVIVLMVLALAGVAVVVVAGSRRPGWAPMGCLAVAAGAAGTYSWLSLAAFLGGHTELRARTGPADVAGQVLLILIVFGLIGLGVLRSRPARVGAGSVLAATEQAPAR